MYCTQCGSALAEGARFCSKCGAPADPLPAASGLAQPLDPPPAPAWQQAPAEAPTAGAAPAITAAPVAAAAMPRYAGFWRRFWGLVVDRFAIGVVLFPVGIILGINLMWPFTHAQEFTPDLLVSMLFGSLSMLLVRGFTEWVYFAGFQGSPRQATPGQMLLGVRVTDLAGERIGFARASGRYFASWLSAIPLLLGFIVAAFTARRQAWHDMIAGTLVVRDSRGGA